MAKRTFLDGEQWSEAQRILLPPLSPPYGQVLRDHALPLDFSSWLGLLASSQLRQIPEWERADPVTLGSWSRGELCPRSDLDVLFCGDEEAVAAVVARVESQGLSLRYRMPKNMDDWGDGVGVLDTNALFWAKPLTHRAAIRLQEQKNKILSQRVSFRKKLFEALSQERQLRQRRYDSIANFLEPNLKFGSGGLRDLQQAEFLVYWFPEKFPEAHHAFRVLHYYKSFFLTVRQKLHLQAGLDVLAAPEQQEIADWFGYRRNLFFMREIQKGLSRVSFHADWIFARCRQPNKKLAVLDRISIRSWKEAFQLLNIDSGALSQYRIRRALHQSQGFKEKKESRELIGRQMRKILGVHGSEEQVIGFFRSHMVSHAVGEFSKIIGWVQHDQYHRYSVDAHILQAVREVKKVQRDSTRLGRLSIFCKKLKDRDWESLAWAALYHDIAKGREGAHEVEGAQIVSRDLAAFGVPAAMIDQVAWLVKNHLVLSTAAFRKNAQSRKTWQELYQAGVMGSRIGLLAVFTAIDIRATNPEAWTSWKEQLLYELAEVLKSPGAVRHFELVVGSQKLGEDFAKGFVQRLDGVLSERLPTQLLLDDFHLLVHKKKMPPLFFKDGKGYIWIRFSLEEDREGFFLEVVQKLAAAGCNIRYAAIATDRQYGVYDWFQVRSKAPIKFLSRQLQAHFDYQKEYSCFFSEVQLVNAVDDEWVFSFRARDRKGLLVTASQALYDLGMQISWAKVHTWGRQIDDIFGVHPVKGREPQDLLRTLQEKLVREPIDRL